jgi:translation initiation factor IF-1
MQEEGSIEIEGTILHALSNTRFRVEMMNGNRIIAQLSSEIRMNLIRFLPGDKVLVAFHPYDLSSGRIIAKR